MHVYLVSIGQREIILYIFSASSTIFLHRLRHVKILRRMCEYSNGILMRLVLQVTKVSHTDNAEICNLENFFTKK